MFVVLLNKTIGDLRQNSKERGETFLSSDARSPFILQEEETTMGDQVQTSAEGRKYRVQLDFSEEAFNELNALQDRLGAPSRAEVVRSALALLRWTCDKLDDDYQIVAMGKDQNVIVEPV